MQEARCPRHPPSADEKVKTQRARVTQDWNAGCFGSEPLLPLLVKEARKERGIESSIKMKSRFKSPTGQASSGLSLGKRQLTPMTMVKNKKRETKSDPGSPEDLQTLRESSFSLERTLEALLGIEELEGRRAVLSPTGCPTKVSHRKGGYMTFT